MAPVWLLAVFAHLVATTQSFLVQRKWVFKPEQGHAVAQYVRFQLVYLGLVGVGLLMLQALIVQGWHPLAAQALVMAVQAFSGFVLGKSFTFNPESFSLRRLGASFALTQRGTAPVWLVFIVSLYVFHRYLAWPFYSSLDHVGHDFALSATALLEGRFWLQTNGVMAGLFNPPWFTPAWCAGAAFLADPQAGYYAPFQWLALALDPFQATSVSALLFAAAAFWGGYLLARRVLIWETASSTLFGILGMANAFMPMRSAVGELGYQPLYLWAWLVLALSWRTDATNWRGRTLGPALGVAITLTAWLHFGFAGMMVPAFLGAMLLCLALALVGRVQLTLFLARALVGGVLAILLNGSKLFEASSLMRNFPRDFYSMPGFASALDALIASVMALFFPSQWTGFFSARRLSGVQFSVLPHEWALEFGLGALAVALVAGVMLLIRRSQHRSELRATEAMPIVQPEGVQRVLLWCGVLLLMALPVLLLWNQGALRDVLKQIPLLNSASWPMRWIVIYLPLTQWLLAWPVQQVLARLPNQRHTWACAAAAVAAIWLGQVLSPVDYYLNPQIQSYDPKPVLRAHAQSLQSGPIPIDRIELSVERGIARNDSMLEGASQAQCYNPLYGYRLESFPQKERMHPGPALASDNSGQSLIFNPACLVHPEANACKPGDGFRMDDPAQRKAAEDFVARRPFEWQRPWIGKLLSWISQGLFWLILSLLSMQLWKALLTAASLRRAGR